jgi:hypothetical protein
MLHQLFSTIVNVVYFQILYMEFYFLIIKVEDKNLTNLSKFGHQDFFLEPNIFKTKHKK